jgi:transposase-like protein
MPTSPQGSPFARPRWTERDAREVIAALDRSGKPVSAFAAEHGLDPQRVYLWRRRLGRAERTIFQELIVPARAPRPSADAATESPFEIVLASGAVVRVPPSFDATALARLLDVLVQARAC